MSQDAPLFPFSLTLKNPHQHKLKCFSVYFPKSLSLKPPPLLSSLVITLFFLNSQARHSAMLQEEYVGGLVSASVSDCNSQLGQDNPIQVEEEYEYDRMGC